MFKVNFRPTGFPTWDKWVWESPCLQQSINKLMTHLKEENSAWDSFTEPVIHCEHSSTTGYWGSSSSRDSFSFAAFRPILSPYSMFIYKNVFYRIWFERHTIAAWIMFTGDGLFTCERSVKLCSCTSPTSDRWRWWRSSCSPSKFGK